MLRKIYRGAKRAARTAERALKGGVFGCSARGVSLRVSVASETEQYRAETFATKEPETLAWLEASLRDGDVLFDVGANIGLYSLFAAKLRPGAKVYAFEPAAQNFARLARNIGLNGCTNVVPCSFPLSDKGGFGVLELSSLEEGAALHALDGRHDFETSAPPALRQGTVCATLDELVASGLPQPTLLKLDVDGIEEPIVRGGAAVLSSETLRGVLVETVRRAGEDSSPLEDALRAYGLSPAGESEWVVEKQGKTARNRIFARNT